MTRASSARAGEAATGRWPRWRAPAKAGQRYLDRPYASVQLLLLAGVCLLGFGVLMAASTTISAAHNNGGNAIWTQLIREVEFVTVGLPIFWIAIRMSPRGFQLLAYPLMLIAVFALMVVLVPGIGVGVYGARRWIDLGPLQLQPSELAKLAILMWGADLLSRKQRLGTLTRARHVFVPLFPVFVIVCGLVMLEPDLGTTLCFVLILLGLLWTLGLPMRYFALVIGSVVAGVTALAVLEPYRLQRLLTFMHPFQDHKGSGYQTVEGLYALASGGVFGVGLGNGTSKYSWVPNASTDYVFSVIGEELGLIGCLAVLLLFALFAYAGTRISRRSADPFVRLTAGAATVWLCGQAVINIGYVTALLPVTGIPLPFISAGGTSLLATFLVFGMLVSFARHEPEAIAEAQRKAARGTRSRLERWVRIPVPKAYAAPKRRSASKPKPRSEPASTRAPQRAATPAPRRSAAAAPQRAAAPRRAAAPMSRTGALRPAALRPTGTDGHPPRRRA